MHALDRARTSYSPITIRDLRLDYALEGVALSKKRIQDLSNKYGLSEIDVRLLAYAHDLDKFGRSYA